MPLKEIQGERVEEARFNFDEAVIGARGDGQLRVREEVKQLGGLCGACTVAVADEDEHRVGYRGKVLVCVVKGRQPQQCDLPYERLPVLRAVGMSVRLAQVVDKVGLLPLELPDVHV